MNSNLTKPNQLLTILLTAIIVAAVVFLLLMTVANPDLLTSVGWYQLTSVGWVGRSG